MDGSQLPKGQSAEVSPGRTINLPGTYVHKPTGSKFITVEGNAGVVQADALMSPIWEHQWERVGEVPSRVELLKIQKERIVEEAAAEALAKGKEAAELKAATKAAIEKDKTNVTEAALA